MSDDVDDIDLSDDEGHAGDDWESLLNEAGAGEEGGAVSGELLAAEIDPEAAGYRDILLTAFATTSDIFGLDLSEGEIGELSRAWGRLADHALPSCPTQASPLADAVFTTGAIAVPRVLARFVKSDGEGQNGQEQGQDRSGPKVPSKVVPFQAKRGARENDWASEQEKEW